MLYRYNVITKRIRILYLSIIVLIFAFFEVTRGYLPFLKANWKNPLLLFGSIGTAPIFIGIVLFILLKRLKREYSISKKFSNQSNEAGTTIFYSSKENPNILASFTDKSENVKINAKFTINGESLSEE